MFITKLIIIALGLISISFYSTPIQLQLKIEERWQTPEYQVNSKYGRNRRYYDLIRTISQWGYVRCDSYLFEKKCNLADLRIEEERLALPTDASPFPIKKSDPYQPKGARWRIIHLTGLNSNQLYVINYNQDEILTLFKELRNSFCVNRVALLLIPDDRALNYSAVANNYKNYIKGSPTVKEICQ